MPIERPKHGEYILLKTEQASAIKQILEFREMIQDMPMVFERTRVSMMAMDSGKTVLVGVELFASDLGAGYEYFTDTDNVVAVVNLNSLYKLIKSCGCTSFYI